MLKSDVRKDDVENIGSGRKNSGKLDGRNAKSQKVLSAWNQHSKGIRWCEFSGKRAGICCDYWQIGKWKSTLLHMLGGLDTPSEGEVCIAGKNIAGMNREELTIFRRRKVGFIFQSYNLVQDLNVYENIVLPIRLDGKRVDRDFVEEIMQLLQINDKKQALPGTLSGGQQQRVAIARALAAKPQIILADEPTGNLDSVTSHEVMGLLKVVAKRYAQTIILITHDQDIAQMADRIVRIEDGRIVSGNLGGKVGDHDAE